MNITLLGPDWNNSTDGVIWQGTENLLRHAHPNARLRRIFLQDTAKQVWTEDDLSPADMLVIVGTPWLWDSFQSSWKYRNALELSKRLYKARLVFMGIGSCLSIHNRPEDVLKRSGEVEGMRELFSAQRDGGTTVIVRDELAEAYLTSAGVDCTFLPCPAYFAYGLVQPDWSEYGRPVMVVQDPRASISAVDYVKEHMRMRIISETYKAFYNDHNPLVKVVNAADLLYAVSLGFTNVQYLEGWKDTLHVMSRAGVVLSGRAHCAVPAAALGKPVKIIPIDSRADVLLDWGIEAARSASCVRDGFKFLNTGWEKYVGDYMELLK
jgi:polysaccharide pyruvyl transferase WcaK-like protein